jgi:hypothetical protein
LSSLATTSKPKASEPILLWEDKIIDGCNRYEACKRAGVEPVIKRIEFPGGRKEALAYVLSRNLKRRQLTGPQRDLVINRLKKEPDWAGASNRAIAKEIGVSEATVRRADLSASSDAGAAQPTENIEPTAGRERRIVHRGGQQYTMTVPPKPEPEPEPPEALVERLKAKEMAFLRCEIDAVARSIAGHRAIGAEGSENAVYWLLK